LLEVEAKAQFELMKSQNAIKAFKYRIKLQHAEDSNKQNPDINPTEIDVYIVENRHLITDDFRQLLEKPNRRATEAAKILGEKSANIRKYLNDGKIKPGIGDKPKPRMICSLSLAKFLINGETAQEQENGGLDG